LALGLHGSDPGVTPILLAAIGASGQQGSDQIDKATTSSSGGQPARRIRDKGFAFPANYGRRIRGRCPTLFSDITKVAGLGKVFASALEVQIRRRS